MKIDSLIKYERPEVIELLLLPESILASSGLLSTQSIEDPDDEGVEENPFIN